jgi:hypothetical protein
MGQRMGRGFDKGDLQRRLYAGLLMSMMLMIKLSRLRSGTSEEEL